MRAFKVMPKALRILAKKLTHLACNSRMKMISLFGVLFFSLIPSARAADADSFRNPDRSCRPETWFHLIGGNVSKEGMDADLDAIANAGISGIHLFHGRSNHGEWPNVKKPIPCLSEDWDDLIRFVAEGCEKRRLTFKMQNCPGWSMSGGPWIAPSNAMRNLTYSRTDVRGGVPVNAELPIPRFPLPEVKISDKDRDYQDLFVLAFPTPQGDEMSMPEPELVEERVKSGKFVRRRYRFPHPVTVSAVEIPSPHLLNRAWAYDIGATVQISAVYEDGKHLKTLVQSSVPNGCWQDNVPFTISAMDGDGRIEPTDTWDVDLYCRHPLTVPYVRFHTGLRSHNWEGKAGWVLREIRSCEKRYRSYSEEKCVNGDKIIDLTDKFADGRLNWTPPEGKWTILRIGHVNNGSKNAPAPPEATGWECNKMDPRGIDTHFAAYIGRLAKGPLAGGKLKGFIVDSWECRRQTWTEHLERDFRSARGYELRKNLPCVFGWVVDSPEKTDSFLRDWRQTLGELIEKNYYARMAEIARMNGMIAQYEAAFGDVLPGDILSFWKYCDTPMTEFWYPRAKSGVGQDDFKPILPCASSAHIYGKLRVSAEAFTTTALSWAEDLKRLKACANHAFSRGVTHLVFHTYTHNPHVAWKLPGTSFGRRIGTPFIRGQAWWKHMPEFTVWAARCCTMLEAGKPANDILWFLGEDVDHKPNERSPFPHGYKYDYINRDALLSRVSIKNGLFTAPDGTFWKVLWVPPSHRTPEVNMKLQEFAKAGGRVVYGRRTTMEKDILKTVEGLPPDVVCGPDLKGRAITDWRRDEQRIEWLHRRGKDAEWYFVSSNGMDAYRGEVTFRMEGDVCVWDPVTGEIRHPTVVRAGGGFTTLMLNLAPAEDLFVVFSRNPSKACRIAENVMLPTEDDFNDLRNLRRWTLSFPKGWGAPESIELDRLVSWTDLPVGREGRHFSGTATYRTDFVGVKGENVVLDLGEVEFVADVFVNGRKVRTMWAPPYRCGIGEFVLDGKNELRIDVTSTWFNRLAYDAGLPESERKTWTISAPKADAAPKPAGLLGPVTLRR